MAKKKKPESGTPAPFQYLEVNATPAEPEAVAAALGRFVDAFVQKEKRERAKLFLLSDKKRDRGIHELWSWLDTSKTQDLDGSTGFPQNLKRRFGDLPGFFVDAYSSYYLEEIEDLDATAAALVESGIAGAAYVADGLAFWPGDDELCVGLPELDHREHETHARIQLPEGIEGWAEQGLFEALCHRFSENKVLSPRARECHEYLRAILEPSVLTFGERVVVLFPTLKLYKTGVFVISYRMQSPKGTIGIPELVEDHVNLFTRWCDKALVPTSVAAAGVFTSLMEDPPGFRARWRKAKLAEAMSEIPSELAFSMPIGDKEFSFYPAHIDLAALCVNEESDSDSTDENAESEVRAPDLKSTDPNEEPSEEDADLSVAAASEPPEADSEAPSDDPGGGAETPSPEPDIKDDRLPYGQSYMLSDLFHNAEYAIRVSLDTPRTGKPYAFFGPRRPRLTAGGYWQSRPQVTIHEFDEQPTSASETREKFGDELGLIMARVTNAPAEFTQGILGDTLRPFEDHSFHISKSVTLTVYSSREGIDELYLEPNPPLTETTERAVMSEFSDYLAMRCHQLDEGSTTAATVREARAIRTELGAVENLVRTGIRAGELNDAARVAWDRLELPEVTREIREKLSLAAEAASENAQQRANRFNLSLALVFGLVGTAGLSEALTKPIWKYLDWPMPRGLEEPAFFGLSAVAVFALLGIVTILLGRR